MKASPTALCCFDVDVVSFALGLTSTPTTTTATTVATTCGDGADVLHVSSRSLDDELHLTCHTCGKTVIHESVRSGVGGRP
mmetsp:Transcript_12943/g.30249  ORF Transcript_12943/g.30249 Transcript_12943/m.30249 type:complete len:81 (-) Transcript_12943:89-331(-)